MYARGFIGKPEVVLIALPLFWLFRRYIKNNPLYAASILFVLEMVENILYVYYGYNLVPPMFMSFSISLVVMFLYWYALSYIAFGWYKLLLSRRGRLRWRMDAMEVAISVLVGLFIGAVILVVGYLAPSYLMRIMVLLFSLYALVTYAQKYALYEM